MILDDEVDSWVERVEQARREAYAEGFAEGMADGLVLGAEAEAALPRCADCGVDVPPGHGLLFGDRDIVPFCERCVAKRLTGCWPKP